MGLWETNLFKFLNIFFCEKPLFSLHIIMIIAARATIIINYCYQYCCVYIHRHACVPQCALDIRTQLHRFVFFPFTVHSGDWTRVVRLTQQVLLPTEPSHWPLIYFSKQYLQGKDSSAAGLPHPTPQLPGCTALFSVWLQRSLSVVLSFASLQTWFSATQLLAWCFLRLQFSAV